MTDTPNLPAHPKVDGNRNTRGLDRPRALRDAIANGHRGQQLVEAMRTLNRSEQIVAALMDDDDA